MDPLCHTLTGAALAEAGLKHRTALGLTTLLVAANVPDVDIVVLADSFPAYLAEHRGWTHGLSGIIGLPLVVTGVMWLWDRLVRQRRSTGTQAFEVGQVLLLSYIGVVSHALLDYTNSYGIQLLKPLSERWFYGDALYVIDPYMYVLLGGALIVAWGSKVDARRRWAARFGLIGAGLYIAASLGSNWWAREVVSSGLARAGVADARFMVTPTFANPFRREVIIDTGDRYERGFVWFEPTPHFRPGGFGISKGLDDPTVSTALRTRRAQQVLHWSRFPFVVVDRADGQTRVFINDYRYAGPNGREGWASIEIEPTP